MSIRRARARRRHADVEALAAKLDAVAGKAGCQRLIHMDSDHCPDCGGPPPPPTLRLTITAPPPALPYLDNEDV